MDTLAIVALALAVGLALAFVIGRRLVLRWEMNNAARLRGERELQARFDHERFQRELTDEAVRTGAR